MRTSDFEFELPEDLIAQRPLEARSQSRMLVLDRSTGQVDHRRFRQLPDYLRGGDVLVLNNSGVIRARVQGVNTGSGGRFELLLVQEVSRNDWWAMVKPGRRARVGTDIQLTDHMNRRTAVHARVTQTDPEGLRRLSFSGTRDVLNDLDHLGQVPLPPYIHREPEKADLKRYQTVFARRPGSVAAPTAGLHFDRNTLEELRARGVAVCEITLHVGLGTFAPVKSERLEDHVMHEEAFEIPSAVADRINQARRDGQRVLAAGTTTLRALESAATPEGIRPGNARTRLFVRPPFKFHAVDLLLTNFHLPRSTLLMLVSAFAAPGETRGRELLLRAYREAVRERYRFFSYGDAMLIR